jgi:hypothetical protein
MTCCLWILTPVCGFEQEADAANAARVAAAAEAEAAAAAAAAEAARVARDAAAAAEMMRWTEALAQKRSALEPEPAVSAPGSAGGGVVRLRLQFPDGSRKDRRFRAQSTIQVNYPRRMRDKVVLWWCARNLSQARSVYKCE